MSSRDHETTLSASLGDLFPELCGAPVDLEGHAASVIMRVLNDGSPGLQEHLIRHYGIERVQRTAQDRADRLSNPTYRAWHKRLDLPPRNPEIAFVQGLWRK